jgi:RNA polymerase sigma factor (sigma-70 family)
MTNNTVRNKNEADLLLRARNGDQLASEQLFVLYLRESVVIRSLLRRAVSDPEQRTDVLHEIFVVLITAKSTFRGDSSLSTYVYRVARITIFQKFRRENALKRGRIYRMISEPLETLEDHRLRSPEQLYRVREFRKVVIKTIAKLPEKFREPVRLRLMEELSYAEISAATKETISNIAFRVKKGQKLLAARLKQIQPKTCLH